MNAVTLIEIPQWGTVTLIEAIWLFSGLLAFSIAGLRMRILWHDYQNTKALNEKDLSVIAVGYLRQELIRIIQSICVVAIGLYAAIEPPAISGPARVSITGLVVTGTLVGISFLIAFQSVLAWYDRNRVRRIIGEGVKR